MKKIFSIIIAVVLIIGVLPLGGITAIAETSGTTGDCIWTLNGTVLTISGNGKMGDYTPNIDEHDAPWAYNLTEVIIREGVTSIGEAAFFWCGTLTSITIPNSVTSIGESAFYWCKSLTNITIPDSVTSIGESAFNWCESLTNITIPDSVTSIGDFAFFDCQNLTSISIGNSVTSIGRSAFYGCKSLTSITIPDSVTSIGDYAFKYCESLTSIIIPDSVTNIVESAFSGCTSLTSITIPDSVTSIGNRAFQSCKSLTSIIIFDSVTSIGDYAFSGCDKLEKVYYSGTESEWGKISVKEGNEKLLNAHMVYRYCMNHNYNNLGVCPKCNFYIESYHDYSENTDETYIVSKSNAESIKITFSDDTYVEEIYDFIYIYDKNDNEIGKYTGDELASKTVTVNGDTAKIRLLSDKMVNAYGFRVTNIVFNECAHNYANGNCTYCNAYLESDHNYSNLFDETWEITRKGAKSITITFSAETFVEEKYDFIYIYDKNGNEIGKYDGNKLASKSITVNGDTVKIRLSTDRAYNYYGFKITDIKVEYNGDLNVDNLLNAEDLVLIKNALLSEKSDAEFDINGDGYSDIRDIVSLKKIIAVIN